MKLDTSHRTPPNLVGFERTAKEQALENLAQALRVLELAPRDESQLCPHPLTIVRAEIENARRYIAECEVVSAKRKERLRPLRTARSDMRVAA